MIDLKNMLPGYSSQQLAGLAGIVDVPTDATSISRPDVGIALLREEQLIDVGFVVLVAPGTSGFTISFGMVPAGTAKPTDATNPQTTDVEFTAAFTVATSVTAGTVYRVSDGTLSWTTLTTSMDTENERRVPKGGRVFACIDAAGTQANGVIAPFCIMRPNESLDPIA